MHYKNGREAKDGDFAIDSVSRKAGIVKNCSAQSDRCNAHLYYPQFGGTTYTTVTLGECYHVDDAVAALEPKATG